MTNYRIFVRKNLIIATAIVFATACNSTQSNTENTDTSDYSKKETINHNSQYIETQLYSNSMQQNRTIAIYLPANYTKTKTYPVIYSEDGLVIATGQYKELLDSMINNKLIEPIIVACSYENKNIIPGYRLAYRNAEYVEDIAKQDPQLTQIFNNHMNYFLREFVPFVENNYSVSKERSKKLYYGTSNSADFGLTLSFRNQELFSEYWCFSPVYSVLDDYPKLSQSTRYFVNWGTEEQKGDRRVYFSNIANFLKKSGGEVSSWTFNGGHDRPKWREEFGKMLQKRFSANPTND